MLNIKGYYSIFYYRKGQVELMKILYGRKQGQNHSFSRRLSALRRLMEGEGYELFRVTTIPADPAKYYLDEID